MSLIELLLLFFSWNPFATLFFVFSFGLLFNSGVRNEYLVWNFFCPLSVPQCKPWYGTTLTIVWWNETLSASPGMRLVIIVIHGYWGVEVLYLVLNLVREEWFNVDIHGGR